MEQCYLPEDESVRMQRLQIQQRTKLLSLVGQKSVWVKRAFLSFTLVRIQPVAVLIASCVSVGQGSDVDVDQLLFPWIWLHWEYISWYEECIGGRRQTMRRGRKHMVTSKIRPICRILGLNYSLFSTLDLDTVPKTIYTWYIVPMIQHVNGSCIASKKRKEKLSGLASRSVAPTLFFFL